MDCLFIVCSIPIFTFGASFTALYYVINKNFKFERGYALGAFWDGFKSNFKQSTIVSLIFLAITFVLLGDIAVIRTFAETGQIPDGFQILFYIVLVILSLYNVWVFAYISMFKDNLKTVFKNCAVLFVAQLPTTIYCLLILVFVGVSIYLVKAFIIITPAVGVWLMSMRIQKSFRRYMTQEQRDYEDEINNMKVYDDSKL